MVQSTLFDARPVSLAQPELVTMPHASGIARVVTHKAGGFTETRDGKVTRTFRILEMEDGRYLREWGDGVVDAAPRSVNGFYVEDGIRHRMLVVEVGE